MTASTVPGLLAEAAEQFRDLVAVVDGDTTLTFPELRDRARHFGAALVATGIDPGDRVAIWAPNSAQWVVAALGVWEAGAVLIPINTRYKGAEAADLLRRGGVKVLFTVTDFLGVDYPAMLQESGVELPDLTTIVVPASWDEFLAGADEGARAEVKRRSAAVTPDDVADIMFTSGTTGIAKGVVQTHSRTTFIGIDFAAECDLVRGDHYLMINPYFHMFGLKAGILSSIVAGATMLPEPVFDADRLLQRIQDEKVTALPAPPTILQSMLDHPERGRYDLSSLRTTVTGAAQIPVDLIRGVMDELPFELVVSGYGLTEGGTATSTGPGDDPETIATTVGRPRPGFELRLIDEHGADVGPGEVGELLLRSPAVMSHYLDDPESTAAALSSDGWLRTGDLGVLGDDGCLRIVGRSKDMFVVGGFNAYPAEIENMLREHPAVADAAVIGVPEHRLGEVGMAFVVRRPDATADEAELIAWARERMANFKVPRTVAFVDALPMNASGKVLKEELRARAASGG
jgi:acyl-CoA synthetase (AMP-forming)/AMP-acid ligase II